MLPPRDHLVWLGLADEAHEVRREHAYASTSRGRPVHRHGWAAWSVCCGVGGCTHERRLMRRALHHSATVHTAAAACMLTYASAQAPWARRIQT